MSILHGDMSRKRGCRQSLEVCSERVLHLDLTLMSRVSRHHLMRDLKPYICIAEPCSSPETPFHTIQDWVQHMQQEHPLTQWLCLAPIHEAQAFNTQALYEKHMLENHAGTFLREELPDLSRLNIRTTGQAFKTCPFCDFLLEEDTNKQSKASTQTPQLTLQKHIASHLEALSLLSLHWLNEDKGGSSIEDSSVNMRVEQLRKSEAPPTFSDPPTSDLEILSYLDPDWLGELPVFKDLPDDPVWILRYGVDENQDPPRLTYEWGFRWKDNTPPYEGHENDRNLNSFPNHLVDASQPLDPVPELSLPPQVISEDKHSSTWGTRLRERLRRTFRTTKDTDNITQTTPETLVSNTTSVPRPPLAIRNDIRLDTDPTLPWTLFTPDNGSDFESQGSSPNSMIYDPLSFVGVGGQFTSSETPANSNTLEEKLWDSRIEWPPHQMTYFIPLDEMKRLVTLDSILAELSRVEFRHDKLARGALATSISDQALKLFTILTAMSKSECVLEFLEEGLEDRDLPLTPMEQSSSKNKILCSRRKPGVAISCTSNWRRSETEAFLRDQWWTLAPVFTSSNYSVRHWELDDRCVLPYVEDGERSQAVMGGYSSVWRVKIHPAHQRFYPEDDYVRHL